MADEIKNNVTETTETSVVEETTTEKTPTVDELMAQIAQLTTDRDKYKSANDKLSKEAAEAKRRERAKMSEEEQKKAEFEENQRIRDEEFEAMKAELNHNKAVAAYKIISDDKMVESLIEAVSDADHNAIATILDKYATAKVKEAQTEWLKSRPQANIGAYSSMTAEQIMAIKDPEERLKAIALNQQAFK